MSPTPRDFDDVFEAVGLMQRSQPNLSATVLARISVPVWSVLGEHDEFIASAHADYLAATIPGAKRLELQGVSHFAPVQRPDIFNAAMLDFASTVLPAHAVG
jgi:pimeloyl-ACP methyl ester carboxylesterase